MAYDQVLDLNQLIANLGQVKNWRVSFVVEYIFFYIIHYTERRNITGNKHCVFLFRTKQSQNRVCQGRIQTNTPTAVIFVRCVTHMDTQSPVGI